MKMQVYSLYDRAVNAYHNPVYWENDIQAKRVLSMIVNDPTQNDLYHNPDDFDMYHLGEFDSDTGHIKLTEKTVAFRLKDLKKGNA